MDKKKKIIIGVVTAVIVVLIVVLCVVCCHGGKDKYCSVIPQDANSIIKIDAKVFFEKHDISLDGLNTLIGKEAADKMQNAGIDFSHPIYAFTEKGGAMGIVIPVKDKEALKQLIESYKLFLNASVSDKQGYTWVTANSFVAAFDDERLLCLSGAGMNVRKIILELMDQDEDESVMAKPLYAHLADSQKPLSVVANFDALPTEMQQTALSAFGNNIKDLDLTLLSTFDIEGDHAILTTDLLAGDEHTQQLIDEQQKQLKTLKGTFIDCIDANPMVWGGLSVSGSSMANLANIPELAQLKQQGFDLQKVTSSVNGDFTFIMPRFNTQSFIALAEVSNNDALSIIEPLCKMTNGKLQSIKVGDNSYCISNGNSPFFMGVKNNNFYVANSSELMNGVGHSVDSNVGDLKDDITSSFFFLTIDAQQAIQVIMQQPLVRSYAALLANRIGQLDRLTMRATSVNHFDLTLSVKDGKDFVETIFK